ncbi:uncharacterized protein C8Q71DRAFT_694333, partial [Rhodofomes roseus]
KGDASLHTGRLTDRSALGLAAVNTLSSNELVSKSKVVTHTHAVFWKESGCLFRIDSTKNSSGVPLNH